MLSSIRKDKNYRVVVKKFEIKRLQIKVFLQDISLKNQLIKTANSKRSFRCKSKIGLLKQGFSIPTGIQTEKGNSFNHTASSSLLSQNLLSRLPRNSSKTRVKNRCIETGRSRSVLRFCKLSRIILREKASKGIIPGVSKASW